MFCSVAEKRLAGRCSTSIETDLKRFVPDFAELLHALELLAISQDHMVDSQFGF